MTAPRHDSAPAQPAQPNKPIGMWDQERESPGLYALLYAIAMLVGLLGHHVIGWLHLLLGVA